jgi:hypothetical protein
MAPTDAAVIFAIPYAMNRTLSLFILTNNKSLKNCWEAGEKAESTLNLRTGNIINYHPSAPGR